MLQPAVIQRQNTTLELHGEHSQSSQETNELAKFFLNFDLHPMRSEAH